MGANLITSLQEIRDFRAAQGRRYPLWLILLLVVMGTISGCQSYYALEDFGVRHYGAVSEKLGLTVTRLPSDTTFSSCNALSIVCTTFNSLSCFDSNC